MLNYKYEWEDETKDACDVCEEQRAYVFALGLANACVKFGK